MHAEALATSLALFVVFAVVGYPIVVELLDTTPLQQVLLAPVAGLCAITFAVATINHLGAPVGPIGQPVLWIALLAAAAYYVRRRPRIPWREARPFLIVLAAAFAIVAWPMALFNFDWISYGNADMPVYLLGGNHFFSHGYFQLPPASELFNERDPSWNTSFYYSFSEVRYAAPLMLAWAMSVTGLSAGAAFMPMIVALHLIVIASASGLLAARGDRGRAALLACVLLAVSANLLSGTLRELLPQDFGLAVLAGAVATLLRALPQTRAAILKRVVLGSLFAGTLVIGYPEVVPFLIAPAGFYAALRLFRSRADWRRWALLGAAVLFGTLVVANENVPGAIGLLFKQAAAATPAGAANNRELFSEFLTPLVFPLFWGLATVGSGFGAWTGLAIACAAIAMAGAYVAAVRYSIAMEPTAMILLVMLATFVQLMLTSGAFGTFKLAMYIQPFLLGTLACWLADILGSRAAREAM